MKLSLGCRISLIESTWKRRVCLLLALLPFSLYYPFKIAAVHLWEIWYTAAFAWKRRPPAVEDQA